MTAFIRTETSSVKRLVGTKLQRYVHAKFPVYIFLSSFTLLFVVVDYIWCFSPFRVFLFLLFFVVVVVVVVVVVWCLVFCCCFVFCCFLFSSLGRYNFDINLIV